MIGGRWIRQELERRASPRAEYRRTAPARLDLQGQACAVRDVSLGGLRIEPAPPGQVWSVGQAIRGLLYLRTRVELRVGGRILRIDRGGLAVVPDGSGAWPDAAAIEGELAALERGHRERRGAPRIPLPPVLANGTMPSPLRDVSTTGIRFALGPGERVPAPGSRIEGDVRLDADTAIAIRGRVVRQSGREIGVALDPPGLAPGVLTILRQRFFPVTRPGR